ncbi:MAG: extracellular solute-binding protein [Clostridiales bacterium]|nr:extracellular solute-binding protein [Clostridiales bacterium]
MKSVRRIVSALLAASMLCAVISSCGKKDETTVPSATGEVLTADSLWYDSQRMELNPFEGNRETIVNRAVFDYSEGKISVVYDYMQIPSEEDYLSENFDGSSLNGTELCVFDNSGNILNKSDLRKLISNGTEPVAGARGFGFSDGKLFVLSNAGWETPDVILSVIDPASGAVLESFHYNASASQTLCGILPEEIIAVTDDIFMMYEKSGRVALFDKEGNARIDMMADLFGKDIFFWDTFSDKNGNVVFSASDVQNESKQVALGNSVVTYQIRNMNPGGGFSTDAAEDGHYYSVSNNGIAAYNEETASFDMKIPADCFNADYSEFYRLSVLDYTEDEVILANVHAVDPLTGIVAYKLKKAQTNPNAGKAKITVGLFGDYVVTKALGKAIYDFNRMNENNYATLKIYSYKENRFEDADSKEKAARDAANNLMRDIRDGKGPDVIVNAFDVMELYDEDFLTDLNGLIDSDKEFNPEDYVKSVIDLAKTDGKLYQMPLRFGTLGLAAPSDCAPSNGTGYSFEEYKGVVSGANNGADSLAYKMDRSAYYSLLFTAMQSDLYKDAKWNLNSPEFEALASYCKDSVPEKCLANRNDDNVKPPEDYKVIELQVEGIGTYISNVYSQGKNIYGYPSANGSHGVIVSVNSSAAISSQSQNKNGAWEFIKNMMSYDIQSIDPKYAFDSSINLKALKERGSMAIADYNRTVQEYKNMDSYALEKARMMGVVIPDKEIDQTATDAYLALLDKATDVYRIDRNVLLITKEELPAYYTGQKDLNSVITIAQDRVQKVMDERG